MPASINDIVQIVKATIPPDQEALYGGFVRNIAREVVRSVSGSYPFWWRKVYHDLSVTSGDGTYDMPANCLRLTDDQIRVIDASSTGVPLAFINFRHLIHVDEDQIDDADVHYGDDDYPLYYTHGPRDYTSNIHQIRFLSTPKNDFTSRVYFWSRASSGDIAQLDNTLVVIYEMLAAAPWITDSNRYLTLAFRQLRTMINADKFTEAQPELTFEVDKDIAVTMTHLANVQAGR